MLYTALTTHTILHTQSLTDEAHQVEEDLQEAEAKNRLYTLLLERTRREHMAIDQQVRALGAGVLAIFASKRRNQHARAIRA